ncbi:MAG TPA: hypothetical protein VNF50_00080 [Acidimicrobiales bacterium]|nr:hypothetical protein [Acidimicrobiales bacterium]
MADPAVTVLGGVVVVAVRTVVEVVVARAALLDVVELDTAAEVVEVLMLGAVVGTDVVTE